MPGDVLYGNGKIFKMHIQHTWTNEEYDLIKGKKVEESAKRLGKYDKQCSTLGPLEDRSHVFNFRSINNDVYHVLFSHIRISSLQTTWENFIESYIWDLFVLTRLNGPSEKMSNPCVRGWLGSWKNGREHRVKYMVAQPLSYTPETNTKWNWIKKK